MRSGEGGGDCSDIDAAAKDFVAKAQVILEVFGEEVALTAARFASSCGRETVTAEDIAIAAKYEAHEFLSRPDLEAKVAAAAARRVEDQGLGEEEDGTEDVESGDEDPEAEAGSDEDAEEARTPFSAAFVRGGAETRKFHADALARTRGWESWSPDDPARPPAVAQPMTPRLRIEWASLPRRCAA